MHRIAVVALVAVVFLGSVSAAEAQSRSTWGWITAAAGGGLIAAAFDYSPDQCPAGYSRHTYDNLPTQCVFISYDPPYDSDIQEATTGVELSRRGLLWAGVGAMVGGVVLALIPGGQAVSRTVDVQMSPGRVTVGRTFGF